MPHLFLLTLPPPPFTSLLRLLTTPHPPSPALRQKLAAEFERVRGDAYHGSAGRGKPASEFEMQFYQQHNRERLAHLASIQHALPPLNGTSVLMVGAGPGDHLPYFLSRGATVLATDGRPSVVDTLQSRYPSVPSMVLDVERPPPSFFTADTVHAFGLLYHLKYPQTALEWMAR